MKIPHIVFSVLFLISCSNSSHYAVLQQADSLMNESPDSAYLLIKTINSDNLSKKDNAYYSLLLTTAQYKQCKPIPNDSIINIAVNYYTDHFNQDKLTKALMYKGGVLADLNFNKLALASYKEAEKIADSTDYMTMGFLNFRMGELYQKSYIKNDEHIKRYKQSLNYFRKAKYEVFENNARCAIGELYSTRNYDSAYVYLNKALKTAEKLSDKQQIAHCCFILSKFYDYHNRNITEAKNLALVAYRNSDSIRASSDLCSHLSILYTKLGSVDSAKYFAKHSPCPITALDTMYYCMMQEEINLAEKDYINAYNNQNRANKIASEIVKSGKSEEYYAIDKEFDNQVTNYKAENYKSQVQARNYLIISIILLLIIIIIINYVLWKRKKRILNDQSSFIDQIQSELEFQNNALDFNLYKIAELNKTLTQKEAIEDKLRTIINERVSLMREIMLVKYQFISKPEKFVDKFNKITLLNREYKEASKSIIELANTLNNNIIDSITSENNNLSERDLVLFSLLCLKFSSAEISVFMGYSSYNSANVSRCALLKKLGITSNLDDFIALKTT